VPVQADDLEVDVVLILGIGGSKWICAHPRSRGVWLRGCSEEGVGRGGGGWTRSYCVWNRC
jgi:hypothetical protein